MRVLLLTTDAYGGHGGIALYNRDISEALVQMPEVSEIIIIPRNMPLVPEPIPTKVRFLSHATSGKPNYILTALKQTLHHYDLVICGHINLLPLAIIINQFIRKPLVLMVYGIDVWRQSKSTARYLLKKVNAVWAISALTRDRMNAWAKLPLDRYVILPNAIHLDRYGMAPKRPDLVTRYKLTNKKVIMTLTRLPCEERYKGVDEVLNSMPALLLQQPTLKYLIAGDGNDRPRLEAKTQSMGLQDSVIFTGMVKEADKADMFRLADVFVMPGRGEGFGFVYLEALACGVPVVGSQIDGSREALRNGMLGELVDPTCLASVEQGILAALTKPKGIPSGLNYFCWSAFAQRLTSAVHNLYYPHT